MGVNYFNDLCNEKVAVSDERDNQDRHTLEKKV